MNSQLLTIGICTRNRSAVLKRSLMLIRQNGFDCPIVIYDDASDFSEDLSTLEGCKVISGGFRVGPAAGRNRIAHHVTTPFLLSLDDDTYPAALSGFDEALRLMELSNTAAVTFRYYHPHNGNSTCEPGSPIRKCSYLLGGATLFRISHFWEVGGYRELLRFGAEDTELAWRLIGRGFQVWEQGSFTVVHDHVATARDQRWEEFHYGRANVLTAALNLPFPGGLLIGLYKGFHRTLISECRLSCFKGVLVGFWDSLRFFSERTPMTWQQYRELRNLRRNH